MTPIMLGALALGGGLAVWALSKKQTPTQPQGASFQGQANIPLPKGPAPVLNQQGVPIPDLALPAPPSVVVSDGQGGAIQIPMDLPASINSDSFIVATQTDPLLLRSSPVINGQAPGEGNVVEALPKGSVVTRLPGTQDQNGFRNVRTLLGHSGWAYASYLQPVSGGINA